MPAPETTHHRNGRSKATSHGELSHTALTMFFEYGFEETTIDDIVTAAGIGRRTFFRYFPSKNDLPWGNFEEMLVGMRDELHSIDPAVPLIEALRSAVVKFNQFPAEELPYHRSRMWLLLNVPSLIAHSTLRYASWRAVIAEYVAERRGESPGDLTPQTIAWACLGLSLAAYEQWISRDGQDLEQLLNEAFTNAEAIFGAIDPGMNAA